MPIRPDTGLEDPNYVPQPDNSLPPQSLTPPDTAIGAPDPSAPNPEVEYTIYGTVKTEAQLAESGDPADYGPAGMPAASSDDAPFSEDVVPNGWSRYPTPEEVAYLNKKYPVE